MQQKLLPQRRPPLATLDYAGTCTQARAVGGDSEYGEARLLDVVRANESSSARDLAVRIVGDVKAFSHTLEQSDDWTLIVVRARRG